MPGYFLDKGYRNCRHQRGLVLIMVLFLLGLAAVAYLMGALSKERLQFARMQQSADVLAQAKSALIGYAIGNITGGQRPGDLVWPDYFASSEVPANYDGNADGCQNGASANGLPLVTSGPNMRCLGRLPWKTLGMTLADASEVDAAGNMPWYAVSANLLDPACLTVLNSETLNLSHTGYVCGGAALPHPWLTVRDRKGNVISDRVAFVLLIPGPPLNAQVRTAPPNLAGAGAYLDSITVAHGCSPPCVPGTYSNADLDNDYVMEGGATDAFNDQVLYVTIDEWMAQVEKRAAGTGRDALQNYYAANGFYPYSAALGDTDNGCVQSSTAGFLPLYSAANCSSDTACTASFSGITSVEFDLDNTTTYSTAAQGCTRTGSPLGSTCTCTGAGYCRRSSILSGTYRFECFADGTCASTVTGAPAAFASGAFTYTFPQQSPAQLVTTGSCVVNVSGKVTCDGAGSFRTGTSSCTHANPSVIKYLPAWFLENRWDNVLYYTVAPGCTAADPNCAGSGRLTVGGRSDVQALIVSPGAAIQSAPFAVKGSAQTRPSSAIEDYLDSAENVSNNDTYDRTGTARSMSYNDQMFVVAP